MSSNTQRWPVAERITIVSGDDWEGLYMNGSLMVEGHHLSAQDVLAALCIQPTMLECDAAWLESAGSLPMILNDIKLKVCA